MTRLLILALLLAPVLALAGDAPQTTPEQATLVHVGGEAPAFAVEMVGGDTFDFTASFGYNQQGYGRPRWAGLTVNYQF